MYRTEVDYTTARKSQRNFFRIFLSALLINNVHARSYISVVTVRIIGAISPDKRIVPIVLLYITRLYVRARNLVIPNDTDCEGLYRRIKENK